MNTLLILLSLFIIIFSGMVARKFNLFPEESCKYFNKFIFFISIPSAVFVSLATVDKQQLAKFIPFVIDNTLIIFVGYLLTFFLLKIYKISREKKGVVIFAANGGNVIYFGFPILLSLYGKEHFNLGIIYATIVISIGDLLGFYLLEINRGQVKMSFKKIITDFVLNPVVAATLMGIIFSLLEIHLPQFLTYSMDYIAKTSTGLALFSFGIYLYGKLNFDDITISLSSALFKLMLLPALAFVFVFYVFHLNSVAAETSVIMASMPSAVFSLVVADIYNLDRKLTSNTIILSSILFLVTSSFWVWTLQIIKI